MQVIEFICENVIRQMHTALYSNNSKRRGEKKADNNNLF
jgi:hypothetical protein